MILTKTRHDSNVKSDSIGGCGTYGCSITFEDREDFEQKATRRAPTVSFG
jgi:hypothetical protein